MEIAKFLLRRTAYLILLALAAAFAVFLFSSIIPGDFFSAHLLDSSFQRESVAQLRHQYGLDQAFYTQYAHWIWNLLHLDLGYSLLYQRPVSSVIIRALGNTLWIGIPALILGFGAGTVIGTVHAVLGKTLPGRILDVFSSIALSLPSLLLGLAALIFAASTHWFPLGSMNSLGNQDTGMLRWIIDRLHHLLLPAACLTIPVLAYVERVQCAAVEGIQNEPYVRSARSRGLGKMRIFLHYLLRPGLNPVLSIAGPMLGGILSGSLVLEVIFAWPGLGQITYDSLFNSDLFLLAGCIMGSSVLLFFGNALADLALMSLDPRTRTSMRKGLR